MLSMSCSSSYTLGLVFIFFVAVIWSAASVVVQYLYEEQSFDSPFLLTYIGVSLFMILIPIHYIKRFCCKVLGEEEEEDTEELQQLHLDSSSNFCCCKRRRTQRQRDLLPTDTNYESYYYDAVEGTHQQDTLNPLTSSDAEMTLYRDEQNDVQQSDQSNNVNVEQTIAANSNHHLTPYRDYPEEDGIVLQSNGNSHVSYSEANSSPTTNTTVQQPWTVHEHIRAARIIAPFWFLANYTYNASLRYTSITSSTVLASTGSLFTYLFALMMKDETSSMYKWLGVACGMLGSIVTGLHDAATNMDSNDFDDDDVNSTKRVRTLLTNATDILTICSNGSLCETTNNDDSTSISWSLSLLGDFLGLVSAIGYGLYAVLVRVLSPKLSSENFYSSPMSMDLFLGFVGVWNFIILLPIAIYQLFYKHPIGRDDDDESRFLTTAYESVLRSEGGLDASSLSVTDNTSTTTGSTTTLTWLVFGWIVLKGLVDNVLSDYLWAYAVLLTDATVATVGLGLTIPMAFGCDVVMGRKSVLNPMSVVGALAVLAGFVLVNMGATSTGNETTTASVDELRDSDYPDTTTTQGQLPPIHQSQQQHPLEISPATPKYDSHKQHLHRQQAR